MEYTPITLTEQDKAILNSYLPVAESVARFWGDGCEVVIHNLSNLDASVVKIINGHLSGREIGAPISEATLSIVNQMIEDPALQHIIYFAKNKRNETFKALVSSIKGENGTIIGLFCINFYLNTSLSSFVHTFTPTAKADQEYISETFVENTKELMINALNEARNTVYNNPSISSSNRNKEIVAILQQKSIFKLKDSVVTVAELLGVSKNTIYMHIRNMNK